MTMNQEEVLEAVLRSENLPTLPTVASKLLAMTSREETTLTDIAALISQDMALSTKVLKVSNSAFYSFPQQIGSINQAVAILGSNAVRSLVLAFSFLEIEGKTKTNFDFQKFWETSLAGAMAANFILEQVPNADTEEIFISGLLQNMGQLIFACTLGEQFAQAQEEIRASNREECLVEREIIGADHCFVGHAVARQWGFPDVFLEPILYHHDPDRYEGSDPRMIQNINTVYLSGLLINILYSEQPEEYHRRFRQEAKKRLGLKLLAINRILKDVHKEIDKAANHFGLKMKPTRSVAEILQEANLKLSLLNLSYEEMNRELIASKMALEKLTKELEHKNSLLENLANIDGLTEVHNHRYFQNFLDKEINRSIRNNRTISILLADLDHFKRFNDTYGHQAGDFILKEFCRITKKRIREYDLLARYGGEEFIFVLPETEPADARTVAEKIRKVVEEHTFDDGEQTYHVTVSIGIASARPTGAREFKKHEFIGLADEALYEAKRRGRNQVAMYQPKKKKKWFAF